MTRSALLFLALASCRRTNPPRDAPSALPDARAVARDVASPDVASVPADGAVRDAVAAADAGVATRAVRAESANDAPGDLVAVTDGAVHVWVVNHDDRRQSEVVAQRYDADGRAVGAVRLLRRTTGPVVQLSADARGDALWVAWATMREATGRMPFEELNVAMRVSADLARVERPVTVGDFGRRDQGDEGDPSSPAINVEVVALDDGGAAVLANGPPAVCTHGDGEAGEPTERVACGSVNLTWISAAGVAHTDNESYLAMGAPAQSLVRVRGGVVYALQTDHIMTNSAVQFAQPPGTPPIRPDLADGLPNHAVATLAWTGEELVALSNNVEAEPDVEEVLVRRADATYATPRGTSANGLETFPAYRDARMRCVQGVPVVTVSYVGGSVTLTPNALSSFRLGDWMDPASLTLPPSDGGLRVFRAAAWAGRALVGLADGEVFRWTCAPNGRFVLGR